MTQFNAGGSDRHLLDRVAIADIACEAVLARFYREIVMGAAENKKLMQELFADLAKGDRANYLAHLADDFRLTVTGQYSWSHTFEGKETALRELYGYVRSRLKEPGKTVAHRFIADGDLVVVEARGDMVTKEGDKYDNHYCLVYRLKDGKIVEMREYQDSTLCERVLGPFPVRATRA